MNKETSIDNCYLEYVDGYLTCTFNHKAGEKCLVDKEETSIDKIMEEFDKKFPISIDYPRKCKCNDRTDFMLVQEMEQRTKRAKFKQQEQRDFLKQSLTELLEEIRLEKAMPPHKTEDFEKTDSNVLSEADLRNAIKHLENSQYVQTLTGYNQAKQDLDNKIDKLKGI